MKTFWKPMLMGLAAGLFLAGASTSARAASSCGDLNNDGTFNASDCLVLAQCLAGGGPSNCPTVSPGPLCGTGNLIDCGDVFGDGSVALASLAADLATCLDQSAHLPTLYDACKGPGPAISCPGGNVTLGSQTITTSQTWPNTCKVTIDGTVFIGLPGGPNPVTPVIKIEKGSVVHALSSGADPAALIFLPGTHIDAQGTPSQPIIMTSGKAPGARAPGDWGGLEFNGKSTVNRPACLGTAEGIPLAFGGCVSNDTSGIMSFVRVEFGGQIFTANNELNDITFNAIGSGSQFNFMAAIAGDDDTFEWFGGTSNHKYFFSMASADDNFDTQLGFTGSLQYGIAIQNPATMQIGRDCRGIELDNSEFDNEALPRNNPTYCNLTMVGGNKMPGASPGLGANDGSDSGVLVRRGGNLQLANSIVQDFQDSGFEMRDVSTTKEACVDADMNGIPESLTGKVVVRNTVFYDNGSSNTSGAATEQAKDNDGTLDTTPGVETGACAAAGCNCDSEALYAMFVSGNNVANANGTNTVSTGITDQYPALDNTGCTGLETPFVCCSGSGTGSCRALPDVRATGGGLPSAFNCKSLSPILDDNVGSGTGHANYLGAVNPAAVCTLTGASANCDWLSKPWVESAIQ